MRASRPVRQDERGVKAVGLLGAIAFGALFLAIPRQLYADPSTRVARPSYVSGQASIRHGASSDWMALVINFPVTSGDQLWTDDGSRTELHIGSSALRLSEHSALEVVQLDDDLTDLSLTQGTVELRVRFMDSNDRLLIETPSGRISVTRPGGYRISVDAEGNATSVFVREGEVRVLSPGGGFDVRTGQAAYVSGEPSPSYDLRALPREDDFDLWASNRDRDEDGSESARYLSREMTGYEALDGHGRWENSREYGPVWIPANVSSDWAPYRTGRWAWVDPWGWTWIDDQPWGFAPFHYGRWAQYRGAWVWAPGERVVRPVYAPALVVFVGDGGWSASSQFGVGGGVAWFALAPGEPWVPAYRVSDQYQQRTRVTYVNVTNIVVVQGEENKIHYRNRDVDGAVTAVPHETFVSARPTRGADVKIGRKELDQAQTMGRAPQLKPEPASKVVAGPEGRVAKAPPARAATRIEQPRVEPVVKNASNPAPPSMNPADANREQPKRDSDKGVRNALPAPAAAAPPAMQLQPENRPVDTPKRESAPVAAPDARPRYTAQEPPRTAPPQAVTAPPAAPQPSQARPSTETRGTTARNASDSVASRKGASPKKSSKPTRPPATNKADSSNGQHRSDGKPKDDSKPPTR